MRPICVVFGRDFFHAGRQGRAVPGPRSHCEAKIAILLKEAAGLGRGPVSR